MPKKYHFSLDIIFYIYSIDLMFVVLELEIQNVDIEIYAAFCLSVPFDPLGDALISNSPYFCALKMLKLKC